MLELVPENLSRRAFFAGKFESGVQVPVVRPPWTTEQSVTAACTGCGDCVSACPEAILVKSSDGSPMVEFGAHECTFCGKCAEICDEEVFSSVDQTPWAVKAEIGATCLNASGIACQLCTDTCPTTALRLDLSVRPVGAIRIDDDACSGCGACVIVCPADAISMTDPRHVMETHV